MRKNSGYAIAYPLILFQFIHFFGNETIALMDAVAVAAVDFGDFAVFQNDLHHPGCVQLAAVAGNEFFDLHLQILRNAEAAGSDDQMIPGNDLHVHAEIQPMGGNLPGIVTAVYINPESVTFVGTGKSDMLVTGHKEPDVAEAQSRKMLSQLAQPLEVRQELRVLPAPGASLFLNSCRWVWAV